MIYQIKNIQNDNIWTVLVPNYLNNSMVEALLLSGEEGKYWQIINKYNDDQYDDTPNQTIIDLITPFLFVNRDDDGNLIPDIDYLKLVDKTFFNQMLLLWSKSNDYNIINLLDEIDDWEYFYDSSVCLMIV